MYRSLPVILFMLLWATPVTAQNTGGVFSPVVNAGHRSAQYRIAVDPDNKAGKTDFAQRLHYQQAIDGDLQWRILGQTRKTAASDFDFDFVQAELTWQLTPDDAATQSGLRFDFRIRDGSRPEQVGINWTNAFKLAEDLSARAVLLASTQLGSNAGSGVNLQTRFQLSRRLDNGRTIGLEMFNLYGSTGNFSGFDRQSHTLGPTLTLPLGGDYSMFTSIMLGLSDAAPDAELRLWLIKKL